MIFFEYYELFLTIFLINVRKKFTKLSLIFYKGKRECFLNNLILNKVLYLSKNLIFIIFILASQQIEISL